MHSAHPTWMNCNELIWVLLWIIVCASPSGVFCWQCGFGNSLRLYPLNILFLIKLDSLRVSAFIGQSIVCFVCHSSQCLHYFYRCLLLHVKALCSEKCYTNKEYICCSFIFVPQWTLQTQLQDMKIYKKTMDSGINPESQGSLSLRCPLNRHWQGDPRTWKWKQALTGEWTWSHLLNRNTGGQCGDTGK